MSTAIPSVPDSAIIRSYTWRSAIPVSCARSDTSSVRGQGKGLPCMLGVDEAGRGPVLGPLVYGIAYCPVEYVDDLRNLEFAGQYWSCEGGRRDIIENALILDSKALTAERRDKLLQDLINHPDDLGWAVRVMSPQDISAGMLRRRNYNLNAQSCDATVELIAGVLDSGVDVTEIYVDTVGKEDAYARLLASYFPRHKHIKWTVTSKADVKFPIVSAASIGAKVTRDRCLEGWNFAERGVGHIRVEVADELDDDDEADAPASPRKGKGKASESRKRKLDSQDDEDKPDSGHASLIESGLSSQSVLAATNSGEAWEVGSGYPGDPRTVAYLKASQDAVFGWPGLVRFSWQTVKTLLDPKSRTLAYKVRWTDEPTPITQFFSTSSKNDAKGSITQSVWRREDDQLKKGGAPIARDLGFSSVGPAALGF